MFPFFLNIFLALAWAALIGEFTPLNVLVGAVLGYLMIWIVQGVAGSERYVRKVPMVISLVLFFIKELLVANLLVASTVIANRPPLKPGIVAIPLDVKSDIEITLLANMITLTPGTWSLDVTKDKRILYVHMMYIDDVEEAKQGIKQGFERRIREVFA